MIYLSLVVPCYNEQEVLPNTISELNSLFNKLMFEEKISNNSKIYFIDDGSSDNTWEQIKNASEKYKNIGGLKLSCNKGHQNAVLAGLNSLPGDFLITIDADLQDDINAITDMVQLASNNIDIVYGVRKDRDTDSFFKKWTAQVYYKVLEKFKVDIVYNHADFRLMSRRSLEALKDFKETNLFLRGIVPQLGFNTAIVYYSRLERQAGESKYPIKKMLSLAWQGITSFSTVPLKFISVFGFIVALLSFTLSSWAIISYFLGKNTVPGWVSTVAPLFLLGGIQILFMGILGEYIGKIYLESKRRPRYFIQEKTEISSTD